MTFDEWFMSNCANDSDSYRRVAQRAWNAARDLYGNQLEYQTWDAEAKVYIFFFYKSQTYHRCN